MKAVNFCDNVNISLEGIGKIRRKGNSDRPDLFTGIVFQNSGGAISLLTI
jgi:hypothetical protein